MTDTTPERGLKMLALQIAIHLQGLLEDDQCTVNSQDSQGLDGETYQVTITTPEYTVTVTPRLADKTPPPYLGMRHPQQ